MSEQTLQAVDEAPAPPAASAPSPGKRRLQGIDICRSGAIILAMSSHAMVEARLWLFSDGWSPEAFVWLRVLMQMAPVTFIILFGAMLEIAYRPRFQRGERQAVTRRLLTRAMQCYLLYVVTIVAYAAGGGHSIGYALRCILMAGVTPYADILKFYALALLFAPAVLALRNRIGLPGLFVAAVAIRLAYPLIHALPELPLLAGKDYLGPITGFLIGHGDGVGAPSLLHGMSLVLTGMVVGHAFEALYSGDRARRRNGLRWILATALVSTTITLAFWDHAEPWDTAIGLSDMSIRNLNHPLYYACGVLTTLIATALCLFMADYRRNPWLDGIKFMGAFSLFTFSFGNVLLYLQPFNASDAGTAHLLWIGLTASIILQTYLFQRLSTEPRGTERAGLLALARRTLAIVMRAIDAGIGRLVTPLSKVYAASLAR